MDFLHFYTSPLGSVTLVSDGETLTGLRFDGQRDQTGTIAPALSETALPIFALADRWLDEYFSGREPSFTPPLNPRGSAFQKAVWALLLTIPYGETRTYGDLAAEIAARRGLSRMSAQAVGGAVGHNPISLIIPCHRVIGADGSLTGYAGGLERKRKLLELEHGGREKRSENTLSFGEK